MNRRHDIDALRAIAFGVLIVYHVGMVYVADWGFHVKSMHQWDWLQWPMIGIGHWRMSLIFLISGIALGLARPGRDPLTFGLRRTWRLLLPLSFAMLTTVPIQAYCEAVMNGAVQPGFGAFMRRYLTLQPWPEGGFTGAEYGVTWNHLWYLAYLWVYTLILLPLMPLLASAPIRRLSPGHWRTPVLLLLPPVYFFACLYWLEPRFPKTGALFGDWHAHAQYFTVFTFGYLVAGSQAFWQRLMRHRWTALGLAAVGLAVYMGLRVAGRFLPADALQSLPDVNWFAISRGAHALYLWTVLLTILAFACRWLNRPFRWLPYANEAVYPWYILHQSLTVPLAFILVPLGLGGFTEFALVLAGTVAGCALLHECLIRRIGWLRPLFGLAKSRKSARTRVLVCTQGTEMR